MDRNLVLVTGGAGYIGSQTCKILAKAKFLPVTFDNLSRGNIDHVKWGPIFKGDLLNKHDLKKVFEKYKFSAVIHLAAKAYVEESIKEPTKYFKENITTTSNLIDAMKDFKIHNLVFSSSCATYGFSTNHSITENTDQKPINPYGFTKFACEQLIEYAAKTFPLNYAIMRYFNAAGADPDKDIGELHNPETHLIPLAIRAAMSRKVFKIYGSDYPTKDGTAVRDYVHVLDLATGHLLALQKIITQTQPLICNLGSGQGFSVLQILLEIKSKFPDFRWEMNDRREGDPPLLIADISKSQKELNWEPANSSLASIIESEIAWQQLRA